MRLSYLLAVLFLLCTAGVQAQMKIAHLNQAELLNAMPETRAIEDSLKKIAAGMDGDLELMLIDIQELEDEINNTPNMLPSTKKAKQGLLAQMKLNVQQFQMDAQADLSAQQDSLLAPVIAKVKKAIDEVCLEKGYNYVFDTSLGNPVYTDPKHDILADVKRKLGII
jgi:outer membrane protein